MELLEITQANFEDEVLKANLPVLLIFKSVWCPTCKRLIPVLEELSDELKDKIKFAKVDVVSNKSIAAQYSILSVPATLIFKSGQMAKQLNGFIPKDKLKKELEGIANG